MNENKKMYIVIGVLILIIITLLGITVAKNKNMEKTYEKFENIVNNDKKSLIYIGASHCGYCQLLNPSIEEMKERYDLDYYYIDTDKLDNKYLKKIISKLDITDFGTPYLAVVEKGKKVDEQIGFVDYDKLFKFLQKNSIIAKDKKLVLNYIDFKEYEKILKSKETNVVVIGQSTCSHCVNAKLVLNEISEEKKLKINYFNMSYLKDEKEHEKFQNSLDYLKNSWGTPLMLIIENGKLLDSLEGELSKDEYIDFLQKNEVLK